MKSFDNSVVTITGGTGSFGSTMAVNLLEKGVRQINIFSRDEAKQDEMRRRFNDERLRFFIGDVRDADSVAPAVRGADYVFHAAALKQVPSCEFFPQQAVKTNVLGSDNVIKTAAEAGVRSLVCLSTDKAVYPVNAMGMSKALMEKTAQAFARNFPDSDMTVSVTRYGNVMYSRGSVIPMFVNQLKSGKPLTLTDPEMTRFLMSLAESVDLVEYAFLNANPGDIYVKKAPGATVEVLARAVASLLGNDDPEIKVIGSRHGEKMHEALLSSEEIAKAVDEGDFFRVPLDARSLQYELYFDEGSSKPPLAEDYTSLSTQQLNVDETKELLLKLPEMREIVKELS
ncbi:UDP-glucose 4-epimerase [Corynebacterium stationis]|uniref:UDP-glucose 4-epimerase n=1 Tax=Corynebacterium stationis TaxID=1705 RepID=A0A177ICN9_9CORY|nr:polysaccharide biosynthesis protein [Corynebacterium stationis]OAH26504.1 UDP-glucose 4-epimerase [Corynebacterium stationis]